MVRVLRIGLVSSGSAILLLEANVHARALPDQALHLWKLLLLQFFGRGVFKRGQLVIILILGMSFQCCDPACHFFKTLIEGSNQND